MLNTVSIGGFATIAVDREENELNGVGTLVFFYLI